MNPEQPQQPRSTELDPPTNQPEVQAQQTPPPVQLPGTSVGPTPQPPSPVAPLPPNPGVSPVQETPPSLKPHVSKHRALMWIGIALVVIIIFIVGFVLIRQESDNQASASSIPAAEVSILADGTFSPESVKVSVNQSVVLTSEGNQVAQLAIADKEDEVLSGTHLYDDQSYSYVFTNPGTYHIYDVTSPLRSSTTVIVE